MLCTVSDLFLLWWDVHFSEAFESLKVKNDLSLRFKDYVNNSRKVLLTYPLIHKYLGNDCKNHLRQISKTE